MQIITPCWTVACVCCLMLLRAEDAAEISVEDPAVKDPAVKDPAFTNRSEEESSLRYYQQVDSIYLDYLQHAIILLEGKLKNIKSIRKTHIVGESMLKLDPYRYSTDVIQYFKLMKRFVYEWIEMFNAVTVDQLEGLEQDYQERFDKYKFVRMRHFRMVLLNYLEIQKQWQVSVKDLADSNYPGAKYKTKLSASDCYTIASHLIYNPARQSAALEWLREALARFDGNEEMSIRLETVVLELAFALSETGQTEEAIKLTKKYMKSFMENDYSYVEMFAYLKAKLAGRPVYDVRDDIAPYPQSLADVMNPSGRQWHLKEVCSQSSTLPKSYEAKLKCRYSTNGSPLFILSPLKEEELYLKPKISIYRQFLTNKEADTIIGASMEKMEGAFIRTSEGVHRNSLSRDSKTYRIEIGHLVVERLHRRTDAMTGLTGAEAEQLQVSYYNAAGYFAAHDDAFVSNLVMPHGNRIATVLLYLNDVQVGGETAFQFLNVLAKPEKGSALVWDDLKRNGLVDMFTGHGACPVIFGHKYIATRWYHHRAQVFHRPCTLKMPD